MTFCWLLVTAIWIKMLHSIFKKKQQKNNLTLTVISITGRLKLLIKLRHNILYEGQTLNQNAGGLLKHRDVGRFYAHFKVVCKKKTTTTK